MKYRISDQVHLAISQSRRYSGISLQQRQIASNGIMDLGLPLRALPWTAYPDWLSLKTLHLKLNSVWSMFVSKWVILTGEVTTEPGSTPHTVMLVSSNKPCEASSYAKSAYLSTPRIKRGVVCLRCNNGRTVNASFPFLPTPSRKACDGSGSRCVNAKGKGFIIQGQSTGEAGLASAVSSPCRETIWMLLCCLIWVPASRAFYSTQTVIEVLRHAQPNPNNISIIWEKNISLYLLSP